MVRGVSVDVLQRGADPAATDGRAGENVVDAGVESAMKGNPVVGAGVASITCRCPAGPVCPPPPSSRSSPARAGAALSPAVIARNQRALLTVC